MKKLLVLTDFTANAAHAAIAAVRLCGKLNTDLLLYHTVQYIPVVPDYNAGSYVTVTAGILFKDTEENLSREAASLRSLEQNFPGYQPRISYVNGEGDLSENIKALSGQQDIRLVVMGGRSGGALDHLITGSDTAAVIRKARKPVLIIPEKVELTELKKVVFATDFGVADISAVNYLLEIAPPLGFKLEVVHVVRPGEVVTEIQPEVAFRKYLNHLDSYQITYRQLSGDRISQRLQDYCHETGACLLAMTPGHHDFIFRVFGHSETKETIAQHGLAVLIFPPDFEKNNSLSS
ncbi:universal stress protein [Mucilaginibacter sp. BJC16-A38]|uniref:universal stress protein n=1 Tax=Mucilaginibacter phenanthrenivorans TaxID=1234842 RepID=UPI0021586EA5|nr:universal stress protein [Mucilaginibacter phenanthrenivorans]MCR8557804.1 universal stress protein [Mucilaginibacter phenanthrenivorans]